MTPNCGSLKEERHQTVLGRIIATSDAGMTKSWFKRGKTVFLRGIPRSKVKGKKRGKRYRVKSAPGKIEQERREILEDREKISDYQPGRADIAPSERVKRKRRKDKLLYTQ